MESTLRLWRALRVVIEEFRKLPMDVFSYKPISIEQMDYELYWSSIGKFEWFPARISIIAERVEIGTSVLDLGCGNGTLLTYLAQTRRAQVSGIDVSTRALELCREKGLMDLSQADLSADDFGLKRKYDYIVITEVLEHIPNPEVLMQKLIGHFNKAVFVSLPNIGFYKHRLRLLCGRFPEQWGKHPGEHLRFWTVRDFERWVRWLGYEAQEVIPTNGFPRLFRIMPSIFAEQIVFVLSRSINLDSSSRLEHQKKLLE